MTPGSASTRSLAAASFAARVVARALINDNSLNPHANCDRAVARPKLHPWKALHACNAYESVSAIIDAQSSSGMFPEVVTPSRALRVPTESSLFEWWRSVRRWRRTLRECPAAADLSRRIAFLASDAAFRYALVASGTRYLRETRAPARIAEQYYAVYWHALVRRRSGKWKTPTVSWQPSHAFI